ncbi:MAG: RHS repeat protein, partial [Sulfurovum sp.]
MMKKVQKTQLILTLSVVASAVILNGCGEDTTKTSEYYVSPLQTQSVHADSIDLGTGILHKSDSDISSSKSLLSVARNYSSLTDENQSFGSWNLGYNSKVDKILNYQHQKNASKLYNTQKEACEEGWDDIDESAFLGKLDGADAIYNSSNGLCDIYQDDEIVASMPTMNKTKKINPKIHTITRADGSTLAFIEKNAKWFSLTKEPYQFSVSADGFELKNPDGSIETYDKNGLIKSLKSEAQTLSFGYNGTKLTSITDSFGQTISFTYTNDVITEAKSFDNTKTLYEYDNNKNLIAVVYADGSKSSYEYDAKQRLTSIKDNAGVIVASYIYDNDGKVISTSKAKGSDKTEISYSDDETIVKKSSGESRYQFLVLNSLLKPISLTTDEGVERYEYDSHGYLKQVVDKLGNISKTTFDENGLLVEQVSNVGSKEEKTTLSSYDTNLRKPLRVLENG